MRYANDAAEEKAAEEIIHREALERSTASGLQLRTSFLMPNTSIMVASNSMCMSSTTHVDSYTNDDDGDGPIDFGGGGDDYDGGDHYDLSHDDGGGNVDDQGGDNQFENFLAMDGTEKYSSRSFHNDLTQEGYLNPNTSTFLPNDNSNENHQAVTFLDEICAGDALTQGSQFSYFNPTALDKLTSGNQWAGAAHWKKNATPRKPKRGALKNPEDEVEIGTNVRKTKRKDQKRSRSKKEEQKNALVNLSQCGECLQALKKKSRAKKNNTDAMQMTNVARQKNGKERNILPRDVGLDVSEFTKFFMRPDANLAKSDRSEMSLGEQRKSVGEYNSFGIV